MISATASSTTLRVLENGAFEHRHPSRGGRRQVDLVGPDAERPDDLQVRGLCEDVGGHVRARAQPQHLHTVQPPHQLVGVQRSVHLVDGDAARGQQVGRDRVDTLDQQGAHRARGRRDGHTRPPRLSGQQPGTPPPGNSTR
jgi:hypothetical protein